MPCTAVRQLRCSAAQAGYQPPPPPPPPPPDDPPPPEPLLEPGAVEAEVIVLASDEPALSAKLVGLPHGLLDQDRKSTRLNSSHVSISYAVFCLKKKRITHPC